ncbi:hypothetical protein JCM10207_006484 [Rhodosporidiobolus poonsookiae]
MVLSRAEQLAHFTAVAHHHLTERAQTAEEEGERREELKIAMEDKSYTFMLKEEEQLEQQQLSANDISHSLQLMAEAALRRMNERQNAVRALEASLRTKWQEINDNIRLAGRQRIEHNQSREWLAERKLGNAIGQVNALSLDEAQITSPYVPPGTRPTLPRIDTGGQSSAFSHGPDYDQPAFYHSATWLSSPTTPHPVERPALQVDTAAHRRSHRASSHFSPSPISGFAPGEYDETWQPTPIDASAGPRLSPDRLSRRATMRARRDPGQADQINRRRAHLGDAQRFFH